MYQEVLYLSALAAVQVSFQNTYLTNYLNEQLS